MLWKLFQNSWEPHRVELAAGQFRCAQVTIQGLIWERHKKTKKLRLMGESGPAILESLKAKWAERGDDPQQMVIGSPLSWPLNIEGFPPIVLKVTYTKAARVNEMFSDTLDAIIEAVEVVVTDQPFLTS